jgi:cobalt-zinc-cadmium efflux system membrane fusion protein
VQILAVAAFAGATLVGGLAAWSLTRPPAKHAVEAVSGSKRFTGSYRPKESEWATLTVQPVSAHAFSAEHVTEGKVQVNEDRSTPIFSPYAGRVTKLFVKAGDRIERGQPLFVIEATDMVQAQNDFISVSMALGKAQSALNLAQIVDKRTRDLYAAKAIALKEVQQAEAGLTSAQNDLRSAETALEAARGRLRILGRSDEEIAAFQTTGRITPDTPVAAPIAGTIVQRKVGPGQYVAAGSNDPVFVVGDLTSVWVTAYVRESDVGKVRIGQEASFTVLAYPERVFRGTVDYVAASIDPQSRRLMVRATVDNSEGLLKPEMFANVSICTTRDIVSAAVPREALVYDGQTTRAWVARADRTIELRDVKPGMTDGRLVQIVDGLSAGENVIVRGTLFIDRVASGS